MFFRKIMKQNMTQAPIVYQSGTNIKLIHKAEYCKSIIADGKELITGDEYGEIRVPELNDEKVYITFKEELTDFSDAFYRCLALKSIPEQLFANNAEVTNFSGTFFGCISLKSIPTGLFANCPKVTKFSLTFYGCTALKAIPEKLFANNPEVTDFSGTFSGCTALTTIPENLFANNPAVTDFEQTFDGCSALKSIPTSLFDNNRKIEVLLGLFSNCTSLKGESPYTMIGDKKVHLYERQNYPEHFTAPINFWDCFHNCTGLTDYDQIPSWK